MRDFVGYVGPPEIHDAVIEGVEFGSNGLAVVLRVPGAPGGRLLIEFSRPSAVEQDHAVGMTLYALAELRSDGERRRFSFVNWDEADGARLELEAAAVRWSTVAS